MFTIEQLLKRKIELCGQQIEEVIMNGLHIKAYSKRISKADTNNKFTHENGFHI